MYNALRTAPFLLFICLVFLVECNNGLTKEKQEQEFWTVHPLFKQYTPEVIAVLPMDNFSLELGLEKTLYNSVYDRLRSKGYRRIAVEKVQQTMHQLGIQTPGQLQGISLKRLGNILNTQAVLLGQIDQSGHIKQAGYDAIVVSCSLKLIHCDSGTVLWKSEQWRTAHRQWAIDPINIILNSVLHSSASRSDRIEWLVQEMMKTLPEGRIEVDFGNLLEQAVEIEAE